MQSLKLRKKAYGPRHQNVAMCLCNLAIFMQTTGRSVKAESFFKGALRMLEGVAGSTHHLTAYTKSNFADFLLLTGRPAEALPLAKEALMDLCGTLPAGHRYVKWARAVLKRAKAQIPRPLECKAAHRIRGPRRRVARRG
jgi:hypothetical protein